MKESTEHALIFLITAILCALWVYGEIHHWF